MAKKPSPKRLGKHRHGTPNPIIQAEEHSILAAVDKALASSGNAQIVGINGELPLKSFLNRYLPISLRAAGGHFVAPTGSVSPQIDVMILDSRYPLLAENSDGSVLAMLHSLVATIECKTNITTSDVTKLCCDASIIEGLAAEVYKREWGTVFQIGFAYRTRLQLATLTNRFFDAMNPENGFVDLYLLRVPDKDQTPRDKVGAFMHCEPLFNRKGKITKHMPTVVRKFTPLSDLYYRIVQDSYYTLGSRDWSFHDIGKHVMDYLSWTSCPSHV